jgi:dTDP-4-dehydrorhamnose reductase
MLPALARRGYDTKPAARHNAPVCLDVTVDAQLLESLETIAPDVIINCSALVDVDACEADPGLAWRCNARPLGLLGAWAQKHNAALLHISTDQYYVDGNDQAHDEAAPVSLVNEYARTKYAGEALALTAPQALVLRTAIVGIRGWDRPTFAEWAIDIVEGDKPVVLFADAYTSSINVPAFADAALDLLEGGARGLYNLAASEVYSKEAFVRELATQFGKPLTRATVGSVKSLPTRRANCLGLDVRRAQAQLGRSLPSLSQVVASVLAQHRNGGAR